MCPEKHVLKQAVIALLLVECAGHNGNDPSMFFSKSPAEFTQPIGAFMGLRFNANLDCLVNLALNMKLKTPVLMSESFNQLIYIADSFRNEVSDRLYE